MTNVSVAVRAWQLLQQMEVALQNANYDQARALADVARTYEAFPSTTDDDAATAWFSYAVDPANATLGLIITAQSVTNAAAPTDGEVAWVISDDRSVTITNKVLGTNVATLTTSGAHRLVAGQKVTVAGVGAPFNVAAATITAVTTNTFSYAVVNADIPTAAATGTLTLNGLTITTPFASPGTYPVSMTIDTATLSPVLYGRNVKVPFGS